MPSLNGFVIRPEQMRALQPLADTAFVNKIVHYLQRWRGELEIQLPEGTMTIQSLTGERLEQLVRYGVRRANAYGMSWETSLAGFVVIMFIVAPNFDDHPLIRRVLENDRVQPDERIKALWQHTTDANWEAARSAYDPRAWQEQGEDNCV